MMGSLTARQLREVELRLIGLFLPRNQTLHHRTILAPTFQMSIPYIYYSLRNVCLLQMRH